MGYRKQLDDLHPVGHVGKRDDIAYGILYLASDEIHVRDRQRVGH